MNKKNIFFFIFYFLLLMIALLQVSFFSVFEHLRFVVQLFPPVLLLFLLALRPLEYVRFTIVAGIFLDFFSSFTVGTFLLPLLLAAVVVLLLSRFVLSAQVLAASLILLLVFSLTFYAGILFFSWFFWILGLNAFFVSFGDLPPLFLGVQLVLNAILFLIFFFGLRFFRARFL